MIRAATLHDILPLSILFDDYRIFYSKESDKERAAIFLRERMKNKESVIFVDEENGILTGFTQLYPQFSSTRMQRSWLLNDLFVLPEFRGKGIAQKLIEAAKLLAVETAAAGLLLETEKTNNIGNRLYISEGFMLIGESNFYWWEKK